MSDLSEDFSFACDLPLAEGLWAPGGDLITDRIQELVDGADQRVVVVDKHTLFDEEAPQTLQTGIATKTLK